MTNSPRIPPADLQAVTRRHSTARHAADVLAARHPAGIWQHLLAVLDDVPSLAAEVTRLRTDLTGVRLDRANLAAAALAAIAAHHDGEPDPLCYLRDELRAQGHDPARGCR